jgi:chaperonin GroEL (HSP60 family)
MNKLIKNQLEKIFVTNDAATILREMEVRLPHVFKRLHFVCFWFFRSVTDN